jgi:alpha-tubulin suppressor-like RCC1 family protein
LNHRGQLGTGDTMSSYVPVAVSGGLRLASLSVGLDDACGVTPGGAAYCWGHNAWGELGNGTNTNSWTPALVLGGLRFAVVSTGLLHTCGVTTGGAAYCWGSNFAGELGTGAYSDTSFSNTPVAVAGGLTFTTISAGWSYTCGVTTQGAAYCWGWDAFGQGGLGGFGYSTPTPMAVVGALVFATVSAGEYNTCGVATDGAAYCWGFNSNGDLGDGSTQFSPVPVRVTGP